MIITFLFIIPIHLMISIPYFDQNYSSNFPHWLILMFSVSSLCSTWCSKLPSMLPLKNIYYLSSLSFLIKDFFPSPSIQIWLLIYQILNLLWIYSPPNTFIEEFLYANAFEELDRTSSKETHNLLREFGYFKEITLYLSHASRERFYGLWSRQNIEATQSGLCSYILEFWC